MEKEIKIYYDIETSEYIVETVEPFFTPSRSVSDTLRGAIDNFKA